MKLHSLCFIYPSLLLNQVAISSVSLQEHVGEDGKQIDLERERCINRVANINQPFEQQRGKERDSQADAPLLMTTRKPSLIPSFSATILAA